jgi:NADP-dependent 3-hydroxy acid dehydrogenase YdfG
LNQKTAIITGTSSSIGRATAAEGGLFGAVLSQPQRVNVNEILLRPTGQVN